MLKLLRNIKINKSGASAAEYALILAVVGGAIAIAAVNLGGTVSTAIQNSSDTIKNNTPTVVAKPTPPATGA